MLPTNPLSRHPSVRRSEPLAFRFSEGFPGPHESTTIRPSRPERLSGGTLAFTAVPMYPQPLLAQRSVWTVLSWPRLIWGLSSM